MEWLRRLTNIIMPPPEYEDEQEQEEIKKAEPPAKEPEKAAEPLSGSVSSNAIGTESATAAVGAMGAMGAVGSMHATSSMHATGSTSAMGYGSAMKFSSDPISPPPSSMRPPLTVIDSKMKDLNVKIYNPTKYEEAPLIAADILNKNAAVVNYDYVELDLQLRICDFLNGVCYVTDGYTDKISEKIFLYVPEGVDTVDIAEAVAAVNNSRRGMFAS
ncbi:MAG: cell division protein SepF [Selenomonadaceae bacterium]|nr:cell division protein SepF [Selenomonadaceae bacterium]